MRGLVRRFTNSAQHTSPFEKKRNIMAQEISATKYMPNETELANTNLTSIEMLKMLEMRS